MGTGPTKSPQQMLVASSIQTFDTSTGYRKSAATKTSSQAPSSLRPTSSTRLYSGSNNVARKGFSPKRSLQQSQPGRSNRLDDQHAKTFGHQQPQSSPYRAVPRF